MGSRLSLANKCLAIFGAVILIIIVVMLSIPWTRTTTLIHNYQEELHNYQEELASQLADEWLLAGEFGLSEEDDASLDIRLLFVEDIEDSADHFESRAKKIFETSSELVFTDENDRGQNHHFLYARAITASRTQEIQHSGLTTFDSGVSIPSISDKLEAILVVRLDSTSARLKRKDMLVWLIVAGITGFLISLLAFYLILTRLVFSPVRKLRRVSEKIQTGDLSARSSLVTGDEFEELAIAFNEMLDQMEADRDKLSRLNETLDLKVEELASDNVGLFESSRLKNEFFGKCESRTPYAA